MQVHVIIFGQIVDIIGNSTIILDDVEDTTALIAKLNSLYPALQNSNYAVAVNKQIVSGNAVLRDGNTVALLPPFSGG